MTNPFTGLASVIAPTHFLLTRCFHLQAPKAPNAETWRLFDVRLSIEEDPGKDSHDSSLALCQATALKLKCKVGLVLASNMLLGALLEHLHCICAASGAAQCTGVCSQHHFDQVYAK